MFCGALGYSNVLPTIAKNYAASLNKTKTPFDQKNECLDKAWWYNKISSGFGVRCTCAYGKLRPEVVEAELAKSQCKN